MLVYSCQMVGWIRMPRGMEVGLGHTVLDGTQLPPNRGRIFSPCLLWTNGWMDQDVTWYGDRPWARPHCVRWGHSSPSPKGAQQPPHFSAHVYCGQTAGWIKMPLGTEVCLGPDHFVLDGDWANPPEGAQQPPLFAPCLLWPNGGPFLQLLSSCIRIMLQIFTTCFTQYAEIIEITDCHDVTAPYL